MVGVENRSGGSTGVRGPKHGHREVVDVTAEVDYERWSRHFAEIGSALTKKQELNELLSTILLETRRLTRSDAGSIYRLVEPGDGEPVLRFEQAQNDTVDLPPREQRLPLDRTSLAGYVALEGDIINVSDVYSLSSDVPYTFDRSFDKKFDYRTRSMLVVPLTNREEEVRGVLQLMNRKRDFGVPLSETDVLTYPEDLAEMVQALASQAAVAIERAELDEAIETMIHSMIRSLVNTIEERDEITTGHSRRLAEYALELAEEINRTSTAPWEGVTISDEEKYLLYHAALLHDIGKIAVPEHVLNKKNRLSDDRMDALRFRLAYIREREGVEDTAAVYDRLETINRNDYLDEEDERFLEDLKNRTYQGPDGRRRTWLTEEEYTHLSVKRGNLTDRERDMIEHHARASFEILREIEWTPELESVPKIASMHHERLDGSGYPWGVDEDEIPLLARILCVVDIYEALTASDRPYRSATSDEDARAILEEEAEMNHVDPHLVDLFFGAEVYDRSVDDTEVFRHF